MDMFGLLRQNIEAKVAITDEEFELVKTFLIPKKLRKKQYLLQEGDVCRYTAFVNAGCLRSYLVDAKGQEHISQFADEGKWISDMASFQTGEPSAMYIDAILDSELLLFEKKNMILMNEAVPAMQRHYQLNLENHMIMLQKRLNATISLPAAERYEYFVKSFPKLANQLPQHMIASYLGLAAETLSRARKQAQKN